MFTNDPLSIPVGSGNLQPTPDPFDISRLRLSQDFVAAAGVKKVLNTIPCRKPSKEWFVQTHPDEAYRIQTCVVELKEDSETNGTRKSLKLPAASVCACLRGSIRSF